VEDRGDVGRIGNLEQPAGLSGVGRATISIDTDRLDHKIA
jgi:hypothetical protein